MVVKKTFEIRSYVHLVENGTQGWFTISQILHHTLCMLKEQKPNLSEVFIKSDNAGCYHSLPLMYSQARTYVMQEQEVAGYISLIILMKDMM